MIPRRSAIAVAAGAFATICIPRYHGNAAEFTYKFHDDGNDASPLTRRALEAAAKILRESNGRMEIQVYPNEVLGGDQAVLGQVRLGAVEMAVIGNGNLSNLVPATALTGLPFIFGNLEEALRACDGALGDYVRSEISKAGLYPFRRIWDAAFNEISNNVRPINTPDDLKGLKIKVAASQ